MPFGVTNGVAVFQRAMDKFVDEEGLKDTFPYLDNLTVAGRDQEALPEIWDKMATDMRTLTKYGDQILL